MSKGKGPKDGLPDALVESIKSLLEYASSELEDEVAAVLKQLEARPKRTHLATEYKDVGEAAEALGIDWREYNAAYDFVLKDAPGDDIAMDPNFAIVLERFQESPYTQSRPKEALTRTLLDIILLDRLEHLQDRYAHLLRISPEVSISVTIDGADDTKEIIQGRMDWALNYDAKKAGSILVVWEAKRAGQGTAGLPQLLVYMAGVLHSRRERINQTVFGMLSDSGTFQFAYLDEKKKFYTSLVYKWGQQKSVILAYIDAILLDAIHSSHTTPTKNANSTIMHYQRYLKRRWIFGVKPGDEAVDDDDDSPESTVGVIKEGKDIVLRPRRNEAETSKEAGAVGDTGEGSTVDVIQEGMDIVLRPRRNKAGTSEEAETSEKGRG